MTSFNSQVTEEQAIEIEKATKNQAASRKWREERSCRVTASRFGEIMNMRATTDGSRLAETIVRPSPLNVPAVKWGKMHEGRVLREYELARGISVTRSGLVVDRTRPYLACSPDGIAADRLVEVKGIYSCRELEVRAGMSKWLVEQDGHLKLKEQCRYWWQVQGQMAIVGKNRCDVVVFTDTDTKTVEVLSVPGLYGEVMVPKLKHFFESYVARALFD